jgi:quercetin dioxygenase-like cupin family protein
MNQSEFEAELKEAGYTQVEIKVLEPRPANSEHVHDYDIRGLVLDGFFTVRQEDNAVSCRAGEVFAVPAGRKHSEEIGDEGARVIVGRKY